MRGMSGAAMDTLVEVCSTREIYLELMRQSVGWENKGSCVGADGALAGEADEGRGWPAGQPGRRVARQGVSQPHLTCRNGPQTALSAAEETVLAARRGRAVRQVGSGARAVVGPAPRPCRRRLRTAIGARWRLPCPTSTAARALALLLPASAQVFFRTD